MLPLYSRNCSVKLKGYESRPPRFGARLSSLPAVIEGCGQREYCVNSAKGRDGAHGSCRKGFLNESGTVAVTRFFGAAIATSSESRASSCHGFADEPSSGMEQDRRWAVLSSSLQFGCDIGGISSSTFTLESFSCWRSETVNECTAALVAQYTGSEPAERKPIQTKHLQELHQLASVVRDKIPRWTRIKREHWYSARRAAPRRRSVGRSKNRHPLYARIVDTQLSFGKSVMTFWAHPYGTEIRHIQHVNSAFR